MNQNTHKTAKTFLASGIRHVFKQMFAMSKDHIFVALTLLGNSFIVLNATIFYFLEKDVNPMVKGFIDALWWCFATVTTVGYGDVTPITTLGRIHGIFMMLTGVSIFMSFTALFAKSVISTDLHDVESEIRKLERDVRRLRTELGEVSEQIEENK